MVRRGWVAVGMVALALSACTEPAGQPPDKRAGEGPVERVYAYTGSNSLRLLRGAEQVAEVQFGRDEGAIDAEWTPGGSRFVATTGTQLISIDARTGATVKAACKCQDIAVAGGKVYTVNEGDRELGTYDAATLASTGPLKVNVGQTRGLLAVDGAGERLVTYPIIGGGARTETDVVVLDPATGATTTVGKALPIADTAYTPRGWQGGPTFAYATVGAISASEAVADVFWFDPMNPAQQVQTSDRPLREKTPDIAESEWSSGRDHLWWAADGTLRTAAWMWACVGSGPNCLDDAPHTQWTYDGTKWTETDQRDFDSVQDIGGGAVLELGRAPSMTDLKKQLTLIDGGKRQVIGSDVRRLWAPALSGPPPAARPATREELAARFAPFVWLHDEDENGPTDVRDFIAHSKLWWAHDGGCKDHLIAAEVSPAGLGTGAYSHQEATNPVVPGTDCTEHIGRVYRTNEDTHPKRSDAVPGDEGFYLDVDDQHRGGMGPGAPVYWEYQHDDNANVDAYVYWFFYAYNNFDNKHEGDWERVAVQTDGERPLGMIYWRHHEPPCLVPWNKLENEGGHPVAYSAKGSHGSYPSEGAFRLSVPFIGEVNTLPVPTDHTKRGKGWSTWENAKPVGAQDWWGYGGAWGAIHLIKDFSGPDGPNPRYNKAQGALGDSLCGLPDEFAGGWKSNTRVAGPDRVPSRVQFTLRVAETGKVVGQILHTDTACEGFLELREATRNKVVMAETVTDRQTSCEPRGIVTLTLDAGTVKYSYQGLIGDASAPEPLERT